MAFFRAIELWCISLVLWLLNVAQGATGNLRMPSATSGARGQAISLQPVLPGFIEGSHSLAVAWHPLVLCKLLQRDFTGISMIALCLHGRIISTQPACLRTMLSIYLAANDNQINTRSDSINLALRKQMPLSRKLGATDHFASEFSSGEACS